MGLFVAAGGRQNHGCFSFGGNPEKTSGDQDSGGSSSSAEVSVAIVVGLRAGRLELMIHMTTNDMEFNISLSLSLSRYEFRMTKCCVHRAKQGSV